MVVSTGGHWMTLTHCVCKSHDALDTVGRGGVWMGHKEHSEVKEAFPVVIVDVVTQLCEFVNTHQNVHFIIYYYYY